MNDEEAIKNVILKVLSFFDYLRGKKKEKKHDN
jgi:hypothetical protein